MAAGKDSFLDLERHRELLEQNVDDLSAAIDEWRQWKSEYDVLKRSVQQLPPESERQGLTKVRQAYRGGFVDAKALVEIFGKDDSKNRDQVISVLVNRLDYVTKNIATLEKQREAAENKLSAATVISNPDAIDEDGLPVTEIVEELDDDDNVVSFSLRTPGNNQPQLLEALEKAGLKEFASEEPASETKVEKKVEAPKKTERINNTTTKASSSDAPRESPKPKQKPKKKGVTFTDDTKNADDQTKTRTAEKVEELLREGKRQDDLIKQAIIPTDESEEEARLRRDMLQYNLSELNPVVAELTIDEDDFTDEGLGSEEISDYEDNDENGEDDDDEDDDEDDDDDEDQWGRSTSTIMSKEYRQKMKEIQDRLRKQMPTVRPTGAQEDDSDDGADSDDLGEGIGRIHVKLDESSPQYAVMNRDSIEEILNEEPVAASHGKKSVRFAQELDIAEPPTPVAPIPSPKQPSESAEPEADPLSNVIVERKSPGPAKTAEAPTKKASRFKKDRAGQSAASAPTFGPPAMAGGSAILPERPLASRPVAPSGPAGQTMSTSILEKAPSSAPQEPDELDAGLLEQQVAVEYHKVRNRLIHKQGGFMKEDESPIQPLSEEEGGPKRLSRFKAARLANS